MRLTCRPKWHLQIEKGHCSSEMRFKWLSPARFSTNFYEAESVAFSSELCAVEPCESSAFNTLPSLVYEVSLNMCIFVQTAESILKMNVYEQ